MAQTAGLRLRQWKHKRSKPWLWRTAYRLQRSLLDYWISFLASDRFFSSQAYTQLVLHCKGYRVKIKFAPMYIECQVFVYFCSKMTNTQGYKLLHQMHDLFDLWDNFSVYMDFCEPYKTRYLSSACNNMTLYFEFIQRDMVGRPVARPGIWIQTIISFEGNFTFRSPSSHENRGVFGIQQNFQYFVTWIWYERLLQTFHKCHQMYYLHSLINNIPYTE